MQTKDQFSSFENVTLTPKDVSALQSEVKQVSGWGVEVVAGGGDGVELCFAGSSEDPFGSAARRASARPGEMLIGPFAKVGVQWPATGITQGAGTSRRVRLRVYRERGIARVHLLSGDMLKCERKLVRTNSSTAMGANLAAGASHVVFQTTAYLPLPDDHWTEPGVGVPFREEEGFLEIYLGASGATGGAGITVPPKLIVYAQHRLQNVVGARSLWWAQALSTRPTFPTVGWPTAGQWATSWQYSFTPTAINALTSAVAPIPTRIPYPPNGCRIEIWNPSENTEALQWEGAVYVRGR